MIGTVKPEHDWTLNYEFNILQDDKIKRLKIWGLRYYKSSILILKYMGQLKKHLIVKFVDTYSFTGSISQRKVNKK